ncbi:type I-E CRISPR-associated protein Cas5/CasD [Plasticicumulans acidivorans]|uniref:CRISPR system Cascade subunit CasD n=1 Tax=Plasticicumulans acidivorans TaxID=886464 RepID=A0A317MZ34_9GAMM|nr:type I-E CRISPR-associated protein Cas5/CasD [Plasticicumulans acidivorans]PWV65551.1 CRISPR system Cascade subunit CasD [Plasticicumulans acidivorans]
MEFLVFRLYAPLAAWGRVAVGQERPSDPYPSKSAIVGLLAAALGIRREEEAALAALAEGYGCALCIDQEGALLRDYHTAQVPSRVALKGRPLLTRRDELAPARADLNTILSFREYRCDALARVALWARSGAPQPLAALAAALRRPRFALYLGRKSCPPALPLCAQCLDAATLEAAFAAARFPDEWLDEAGPFDPASTPLLCWELDAPTALAAQMTVLRRDQPRSRRRWQFGERSEAQARMAGPGASS